MLLKGIAAVAGLALSLGLANAAEVIDSDFQVTFHYGGTDQRLSEDQVPLLPGNTCYTWWLRLGEGPAPLSAIERLELPEPLANWGDAATNPDDGVEILEDGRVASSKFTPEIDSEGWFSKGWCTADGDPTGAHKIEVWLDGSLAKRFDFEVLAPEDYPWPALRQPDTSERCVQDSW